MERSRFEVSFSFSRYRLSRRVLTLSLLPVSASGYLQGTVYTADQAAFGTRIRESSMGSLHDHVRSSFPLRPVLSFVSSDLVSSLSSAGDQLQDRL